MSAPATVYALDVLRDVRHRDARAARELADWRSWLELGDAAPRTVNAYIQTGEDLLNAFPHTAFADFTVGDLQQLLKRYPPRSRYIKASNLRVWFRWGYQQRLINSNPADRLPKMRVPKPEVRDVFPETDRAALCALPPPDGALMLLLFDAGLRRTEAIHLTMRRIDFNGGRVIVKEGAKGARDRIVPMLTPTLVGALHGLQITEGLNPTDYLWYDRPGGGQSHRIRRTKPISGSAFSRWWARCIEQAGVPYRNPHMARHTMATRWRQLGLPMEDIQILLGHASISTTSDLYVHTRVDDVADRMRELLEARG